MGGKSASLKILHENNGILLIAEKSFSGEKKKKHMFVKLISLCYTQNSKSSWNIIKIIMHNYIA